MQMRVIENKGNASFNMALDEAILEGVLYEKSPPTLRLYTWEPSAVSVGYFQNMKDVVNIRKCRENGFEFVRRITGGGSVFHDKEITYSIILPAGYVSDDIPESYRQVCQCIVNCLRSFELPAVFKPVNDIIVGEKKISGSAQTRRKGVILQHGTIIMKSDAEKMFSVLNVPKDKLYDKVVRDLESSITSVNEFCQVSYEGFKRELVKHFAMGFQLETRQESPSEEELCKANALLNKYNSDEWSFLR